jgi:hypothetical protein
MIDETRKAARELERLSRERRDAQMQELSRSSIKLPTNAEGAGIVA